MNENDNSKAFEDPKCEQCGCEGCHGDDDCGYETIELSLDGGVTLTCIVLGVFTVGETEYVALLPEDDEEDGVLLYRYQEDDDENVTLTSIETDEEFDKVSEVYYELFDDEDDDEEE